MNKQNHHNRGSFGREIQNINHIQSKQQAFSIRTSETIIDPNINNEGERKGKEIKVNDIIDLILYDPMLKELKLCLEKQAEEKKRSQLIESFPNRYQNLLQTQTLFLKLQSQMKEYQKQSQEVIALMEKDKEDLHDQIAYLKQEIKCKEGQIQLVIDKMNLEKVECEKQHALQIKEMKSVAEIMTGKLIKSKCEKDSLIEYIEEIKNDFEETQQENDRLVLLLKDYQSQIKEIKDSWDPKEKQFEGIITKLKSKIQELETSINDKSNVINTKNEQLKASETKIKVQKYKIEELEGQMEANMAEFQEERVEKFEEIQQVRLRLLQQIKNKNKLEQLLESKQTNSNQNQKQIALQNQQLRGRNKDLQLELQRMMTNKNIQFQAAKDEYSSQICQYQEKIGHLSIQNDEKSIVIEKMLEDQKILNITIEKLNKIIDQLKQHTFSLEKQQSNHQVTTLAKNNHELQKIKNIFKQQISKYQSIITEKDEKIEILRRQIFSIKAKMKDTILSCQKYKSKQTSSECILNLLKQKVAQTQQKLKEAQKELLLAKQKAKKQIQQSHKLRQLLSQKVKNVGQAQVNRKDQQIQVMIGKDQQIQAVNRKDQQIQVQLPTDPILVEQFNKLADRYSNLLEEARLYKSEYLNRTCQCQEQNSLNLVQENNELKQIIENINNQHQLERVQCKRSHEKLLLEEKTKNKLIQQQSNTIIDELRQELRGLESQLLQKQMLEREIFDKAASNKLEMIFHNFLLKLHYFYVRNENKSFNNFQIKQKIVQNRFEYQIEKQRIGKI